MANFNYSYSLRTSIFNKTSRNKEIIKKDVVIKAFWGIKQLFDQVEDYRLSLIPSIPCFNRFTELLKSFNSYKPYLLPGNILVPHEQKNPRYITP